LCREEHAPLGQQHGKVYQIYSQDLRGGEKGGDREKERDEREGGREGEEEGGRESVCERE
jgi:hypothetical protein